MCGVEDLKRYRCYRYVMSHLLFVLGHREVTSVCCTVTRYCLIFSAHGNNALAVSVHSDQLNYTENFLQRH